jgi:hypothetical protein
MDENTWLHQSKRYSGWRSASNILKSSSAADDLALRLSTEEASGGASASGLSMGEVLRMDS